MAMTYTSLVAGKGVSGSIANWVSYTLLDLEPIVDEAQALIYSLLRTREMMTDFRFALAIGEAHIDLPDRFLDPIGRLQLTSYSSPVRHKDGNTVQRNRSYTETSGTLGTDPFTTATGSTLVSVAQAGNGFSQDSTFNTTGAATFAGVTIEGTFPITELTDDDNFVIDIASLGATPSASITGGGAACDYTCDNLTQGIPNWWGIWNEKIYFDVAFAQASLGILQYYQSLPLLSSTNTTNFLTDRYPHLMRTACVASAADFMKDDSEYQKGFTRLQALIDRIGIENDGQYRGMELDTETP